MLFRIAVLSFIACGGFNWIYGEGSDLAAGLRDSELAFARSVADRDHERFVSFIAEDAIFLGAKPLRGRQEISEAWGPFFKENGPRLEWEPEVVEVLNSGEMGITKGPFRYVTLGADGTEVIKTGTFNSVWKRDSQGAWLIVFDSGCSCP